MISGAVLSSKVRVLVSVVLLSQSSVTVNVIVVTPVSPHRSVEGAVAKSLTIVKVPEQSSSAVAEFNQLFITAVFNPSAHSKVRSTGSDISGLVVSSMVKMAEVVLVFPQSSVAVKITSTFPLVPQVVVKSPRKSLDQVMGSLHASEA